MTARNISRFAGRVGGFFGGSAGSAAGRRMVSSAVRQGRAFGAARATGGMRGAFGTMSGPVGAAAMKGAMIGGGLNVARQMSENSSYGAPVTAGMGGAAIRGALGGGMLGGMVGAGRHFGFGAQGKGFRNAQMAAARARTANFRAGMNAYMGGRGSGA